MRAPPSGARWSGVEKPAAGRTDARSTGERLQANTPDPPARARGRATRAHEIDPGRISVAELRPARSRPAPRPRPDRSPASSSSARPRPGSAGPLPAHLDNPHLARVPPPRPGPAPPPPVLGRPPPDSRLASPPPRPAAAARSGQRQPHTPRRPAPPRRPRRAAGARPSRRRPAPGPLRPTRPQPPTDLLHTQLSDHLATPPRPSCPPRNPDHGHSHREGAWSGLRGGLKPSRGGVALRTKFPHSRPQPQRRGTRAEAQPTSLRSAARPSAMQRLTFVWVQPRRSQMSR